MRTGIGLLGLGAGVMYLLDPNKGRLRRALLRDKMTHAGTTVGDFLETASRDLNNRLTGLQSGMKRQNMVEMAPDEILAERVRAKLGRVVSHPRAILVAVDQGTVTLAGPVLAREVEGLLQTTAQVPGVRLVINHLEPHKRSGNIPALQGGISRIGILPDVLQGNWAPATRLLMGAGGGLLVLTGIARGGIQGLLRGLVGTGMLARAVANAPLNRLIGVGAGQRGIDITKSITINVAPDDVFDFWRFFENFPRFMAHVREVTDMGNGRSHWVVAGPGNIPIEFDADITQTIDNEVIAWRSVPGASVQHSGVVHFEELPEGGTRVQVQMTYNPPAGVAGHLVASLFGANPKHEMEDDLNRLKTYLETQTTGSRR